jgi:hypothetical protein
VFARAKRLFICIACSNYLGVSFNVFVALPLPQPLSRKAGEGSKAYGLMGNDQRLRGNDEDGFAELAQLNSLPHKKFRATLLLRLYQFPIWR